MKPVAALTVDEAHEAILRAIVPLADTEQVPLAEALGRILDDSLVSPLDVPAYDNSAMDGYALRGSDLAVGETVARIVGTALAGRPFAGSVGPGDAVRIMTGAVMPEDCDTVVMQESVAREGNLIRIPPGVQPGQNRRLRGEDLAQGQVALAAGHRLLAADVGLIASLGLDSVTVRRRVRVAVFSTGDELRAPGQALVPGAIFDSNRPALLAALRTLGVDAVDLGIVRDDPAALDAALLDAIRQADAVLTSGGVSVGDADFVRDLMARHGTIEFWKISVKPGRPLAFGRLHARGDGRAGAYLFGLPGNPVAAMVAFHLFARPALLKLGGACPTAPVRLPARCTQAIDKKPGREEYLRAIVATGEDGQLAVTPLSGQGSAMLHAMSQANCLLRLDAARDAVAAGEAVEVLLLDALR